jgi:hypothetical protein
VIAKLGVNLSERNAAAFEVLAFHASGKYRRLAGEARMMQQ